MSVYKLYGVIPASCASSYIDHPRRNLNSSIFLFISIKAPKSFFHWINNRGIIKTTLVRAVFVRESASPYKPSHREGASRWHEPNFLKSDAFQKVCPITTGINEKHLTLCVRCFSFMTRTGIEPMFPAWEASVLTAWPTGRVTTTCEKISVTRTHKNF